MEVTQHGVSRPELLVHVRELTSGVTEEKPACNAVVRGEQIQKKDRGRHADRDSVIAEDPRLERRKERQLAGKPRDRQEGRQGCEEGDVSDP